MDNVTEAYLKRQIQLLRAAEGDAIEFSKVLIKIHQRLIKKIEKEYPKALSQNEILKMLSDIDQQMSHFYNTQFAEEFAAISTVVAKSEIEWNMKTIPALLGDDALKMAKPSIERAIASANTKPYQGKTFDQWIRRAFGSSQRRVKEIITTGHVNGDSVAEVVKQVNATNAGSVADVKTLTRSYMMHIAAEAKQEVIDANPEITEGSIWNSTLDNCTTWNICGIRDQKHYDHDHNPVGHDLPYLNGPGRAHFNCRSVEIPILKGVNSYYNRAAIGAGEEYERGDNTTKAGKVRKPTRANVEKGIYDVQQVTTKTRYEGYLKAQAKKNIDFVADILGNKKDAIAFRDGKVTLEQLGKTNPVSNPTNRNSL